MRARRNVARALLAALAVCGAGAPAQDDEVQMSAISGAADQPRRHFRLRDPARLDEERLNRIYDIVAGALARGYARSGLAPARQYSAWTRHNTAAYLSATHGNHYLNNYANDAARSYGLYERAGRLPVGSVIAKDSFSVTESGGILLGPLFLMEKMSAGFNHASGDWRYTAVLPEGAVLGTTNGEGSARVEYCIACHLAAERQDHLYFVPSQVRPAGR